MSAIDETYKSIVSDIMDEGVDTGDRTGVGTSYLFGYMLRHNMKDGFPLLTIKKMYWHAIVTELIWFLRGDTNIKWLIENNCNIWNGDAYKKYLTYASNLEEPDYSVHVEDINESKVRCLTEKEFVERIKTDDEFAKKWGELGPIYGKQWRDWNGIDQLKNAIETLKNNPDSRRIMVNAWNASEIKNMTLPPCHTGFQFRTRLLTEEEKQETLYQLKQLDLLDSGEYNPDDLPARAISLMWNQRSVDTFLGLPFNIASYALLLKIVADEVNMIPDQLVGSLGDTHLYNNHFDAAEEVLQRDGFKAPLVGVTRSNMDFFKWIEEMKPEDFKLIDYKSHDTIKAKLNN